MYHVISNKKFNFYPYPTKSTNCHQCTTYNTQHTAVQPLFSIYCSKNWKKQNSLSIFIMILWSSFSRKETIWGQNCTIWSWPLFHGLPLGVQMYPPPQPTGKMVAGTCEVNIIEEKSVLLFFYVLLHTISNGYPLIHGLLRTHFSAPSNTRIPTTMVVM